jgi:hypothetical protein
VSSCVKTIAPVGLGRVLTEGETELGALLVWSKKSPYCAPAAGPRGSSTSPSTQSMVDQSFHHIVGYLHAFEIPWATVCDGGVSRFEITRHIFTKVTLVADETSLSEASERWHSPVRHRRTWTRASSVRW